MVPGGKVQLTLHDGRNIKLAENAKTSDYKTLDTLKISVPEQNIMETIPLTEGSYAIVSRGRNVGIEGKVLQIDHRLGTHASTVTLEDPEGNRFQTALDYIFVVGKKKSEVSLGGAE